MHFKPTTVPKIERGTAHPIRMPGSGTPRTPVPPPEYDLAVLRGGLRLGRSLPASQNARQPAPQESRLPPWLPSQSAEHRLLAAQCDPSIRALTSVHGRARSLGCGKPSDILPL